MRVQVQHRICHCDLKIDLIVIGVSRDVQLTELHVVLVEAARGAGYEATAQMSILVNIGKDKTFGFVSNRQRNLSVCSRAGARRFRRGFFVLVLLSAMLFRLLREISRRDEKTCADQTKKKNAPRATVTKRQHEQLLTREESSANFLGATGLGHRTKRVPDFRALP